MTPFLKEGEHNFILSTLTKSSGHTFIYKTRAMELLMKKVETLSSSSTPILITGPSGSGKSHLARTIHEKSAVNAGPVVTLNCASLIPQVFESELFGFKGEEYNSSIEGALREASGGTLVLEDIQKMPISVRTKFHEFLRTKKVTPVHSDRSYDVQVRMIYTVDASKEDVENGSFDNLCDQLLAIRVDIPSIEERREDIEDLVLYFLGQNLINSNSPEEDYNKIRLSEKALNIFKYYKWGRNIREIRDMCEHLQLAHSGEDELCIRHLPKKMLDAKKLSIDVSYDPELTLSDISRIYILGALRHFPSKKKAAEALGITVKTLYNRLHEYGAFESSRARENSVEMI